MAITIAVIGMRFFEKLVSSTEVLAIEQEQEEEEVNIGDRVESFNTITVRECESTSSAKICSLPRRTFAFIRAFGDDPNRIQCEFPGGSVENTIIGWVSICDRRLGKPLLVKRVEPGQKSKQKSSEKADSPLQALADPTCEAAEPEAPPSPPACPPSPIHPFALSDPESKDERTEWEKWNAMWNNEPVSASETSSHRKNKPIESDSQPKFLEPSSPKVTPFVDSIVESAIESVGMETGEAQQKKDSEEWHKREIDLEQGDSENMEISPTGSVESNPRNAVPRKSREKTIRISLDESFDSSLMKVEDLHNLSVQEFESKSSAEVGPPSPADSTHKKSTRRKRSRSPSNKYQIVWE